MVAKREARRGMDRTMSWVLGALVPLPAGGVALGLMGVLLFGLVSYIFVAVESPLRG
jgi:hypothetical protein